MTTEGNWTDLVVILDRSASMESIRADVKQGFDRLIAEQKEMEGHCGVTLVQFDTDPDEGPEPVIETVFTGVPVAEVRPLEFHPRGWTPLLDAVGSTIFKLTDKIASMDEKFAPDKVIVVIVTDGHENASKEYKLNVVKKMIEMYTTPKMQFVYLGANVDAFAEAGSMGIPVAMAANYSASPAGVRNMFVAASASMGRYRSGGEVSFTDEERLDMNKTGGKP